METSISTLTERKKEMEAFTLLLSEAVKETDDEEIKQHVRDFLAEAAEAYRFFVAGREKTGRTTLLRNCFFEGNLETLGQEETEGILEIRYGAMDTVVQVENGYSRRFCTAKMLEGLVLYDIGGRNVYKSSRAGELAAGADVILAVFTAENIQDDYTWDFIEKNGISKRVVCILTRKDLYTPEEIDKKKRKLREYMQDLGISSPVFAVSDKDIAREGYEEIRAYICKNIIGQNPSENKRVEHFQKMVKLREELAVSVEKRSRQFREDSELLALLETRIREFYRGSAEEIDVLKKEVVQAIREEIENYRTGIIRQFDPGELRRNPNTKNKKAFMQWLSHEVERYERILNNRVDEKVQRVMRHYIARIDEVCEEMTEALQGRKSFLEETDRFYGSLAASKTTVVEKTRQVTELNHKEYMTLLSASVELFEKVWKERKRYELKMVAATGASTALTAVIGGGIGFVLLAAEGAVVGALVLGTVGYAVGKLLADKIYSGRMEDNVNQHIEEFNQNVTEIRENMEEQVLQRLDELFQSEFQMLDRNLLQFRTMTNIDAQNVPLLENKLQEMNALFKQITEKEECYEYC